MGQQHFSFQKQHNAASFSPIDGRGHKNQIGSEQFLNQRKRNGCSFINDQQFCLAQFHSIAWMDVLLDRSKNRDKCHHFTISLLIIN